MKTDDPLRRLLIRRWRIERGLITFVISCRKEKAWSLTSRSMKAGFQWQVPKQTSPFPCLPPHDSSLSTWIFFEPHSQKFSSSFFLIHNWLYLIYEWDWKVDFRPMTCLPLANVFGSALKVRRKIKSDSQKKREKLIMVLRPLWREMHLNQPQRTTIVCKNVSALVVIFCFWPFYRLEKNLSRDSWSHGDWICQSLENHYSSPIGWNFKSYLHNDVDIDVLRSSILVLNSVSSSSSTCLFLSKIQLTIDLCKNRISNFSATSCELVQSKSIPFPETIYKFLYTLF